MRARLLHWCSHECFGWKSNSDKRKEKCAFIFGDKNENNADSWSVKAAKIRFAWVGICIRDSWQKQPCDFITFLCLEPLFNTEPVLEILLENTTIANSVLASKHSQYIIHISWEFTEKWWWHQVLLTNVFLTLDLKQIQFLFLPFLFLTL